MNYPVRLLPQPIFKEVTEDLSGYFLCRKFPDKSLMKNDSPIINEEILGINSGGQCFDYSTNLPGIFELNDNWIELTGENKKHYRSYWDWISKINEPLFEKDFLINENIGWFFLPISQISNIVIPFSRNGFTPPDETAKAMVLHTPTNSNFWHFSIKWHDGKGFINANDSKWKNNIIATVRSVLSEIMENKYRPQRLESAWYIK